MGEGAWLMRKAAVAALLPCNGGGRDATAALLSNRGGRKRGCREKQQCPRPIPAKEEDVSPLLLCLSTEGGRCAAAEGSRSGCNETEGGGDMATSLEDGGKE